MFIYGLTCVFTLSMEWYVVYMCVYVSGYLANGGIDKFILGVYIVFMLSFNGSS